jgi:hypothetical protein
LVVWQVMYIDCVVVGAATDKFAISR